MHPLLRSLLYASTILLALALAGALAARARRTRVLGEAQSFQGPGSSVRLSGALALALVYAAIAAFGPRELVERAAPAFLFALAFQLARPFASERRCGLGGISLGWRAYPLAEFEEWRLTGDHVRVRVDDEWQAVELARERQARMRAVLEQHAPGRESRFHDRQQPGPVVTQAAHAALAPAAAPVPGSASAAGTAAPHEHEHEHEHDETDA
jgi:hypothetical protein